MKLQVGAELEGTFRGAIACIVNSRHERFFDATERLLRHDISSRSRRASETGGVIKLCGHAECRGKMIHLLVSTAKTLQHQQTEKASVQSPALGVEC